ncbi:MAG: FAD-binding oxidoreductase [Pseudomonadota bacterium]
MAKPVLSWGRTFRYAHDVWQRDRLSAFDPDTFATDAEVLFHGLGRSYGDVALNEDGRLCLNAANDRLLAFDRENGRLKAQSGLALGAMNQITVPDGWIVPVSPGTKYVTLGGAVANDVHGKNHHVAGSFGSHIIALKLIRSDGETLVCSRTEHTDLFDATISGLGLTGYIDWVELQLSPITSSNMWIENIRFADLQDFFALSEDSAAWPYTAAWVDCFSSKPRTGAGIFTRARFLDDGILRAGDAHPSRKMPVELPSILLNKFTISTFNQVYKYRPGAQFKGRRNYQGFFYPLDQIYGWNKLYGRKGFYQHQSIIPMENSRVGVTELLDTIRRSGQGSFLAVLKRHGPETSPGLNSFPLDGVSLALDFPNRGAKTMALLQRLDEIAAGHGGRMYAAKDAAMASHIYQAGYPNWQRLEALRDPKINSSFWRRVTQ